MKILFLWLLFVLAAFGSETVAWRVPIELVIENGLDHPEMVRLDTPPAETSFFEKDDELWDASKAFRNLVLTNIHTVQSDGGEDPVEKAPKQPLNYEKTEAPFEGDFIVWNARSGMLVARGEVAELTGIDESIRSARHPLNVTTTFKLRSPEGERIFKATTGSHARGSIRHDGVFMEVAAHGIVGHRRFNFDFVDLIASLESARYRASASLVLLPGKPIQIGGWTDGAATYGWGVKTEMLTPWGVRHDRIQWIETGTEIVPVPRCNALDLDRRKLADGRSARVFAVPPDFPSAIGLRDDEFRLLDPPNPLSHLVPPGRIDLTPALRRHGMSFDDPLTTAGYDLLRSEAFVIHDQEGVELMRQICMSLGPDAPTMVRLRFEWPGGGAFLVSRSGHRERIRRGVNGELQPLLDVAPNFRGIDDPIDLDYELHAPDGSFGLRGSVTVTDGVPLVIAETPQKVVLTATILTMDR